MFLFSLISKGYCNSRLPCCDPGTHRAARTGASSGVAETIRRFLMRNRLSSIDRPDGWTWPLGPEQRHTLDPGRWFNPCRQVRTYRRNFAQLLLDQRIAQPATRIVPIECIRPSKYRVLVVKRRYTKPVRPHRAEPTFPPPLALFVQSIPQGGSPALWELALQHLSVAIFPSVDSSMSPPTK